jgi:acyl-CoA reductase-like NAD-dependent aldehyde dehydrogenase
MAPFGNGLSTQPARPPKGEQRCISTANGSAAGPATGETIGEVPDCGDADIEAAIAAAHAAFGSWRKTTAYERSQLLYRAWELMRDRAAANSPS